MTCSLDEVIELREHDVKPGYVRELHDLGFTDLSVDQIIELRNHDVKPEYVRELRDLGLADI